MRKQFSVVAQLRFGSEDITPLKCHGMDRLPVHLASILEIFAHHSSLEEAYRTYNGLIQRMARRLPEASILTRYQAFSDMLIIVGDRVYLCRHRDLDRTYEYAYTRYVSGIRTTRAKGAIQRASVRDPNVIDLTAVSRRLPLTAMLLAKQLKIPVSPYPLFTREEFSVHVESLCRVGLLTVPLDEVDFGDFHRYGPLCPDYGYTRGTPIDRYYLAQFVDEIREEVCGDVLEIGGLPGNVGRYDFVNATRYSVMDIDDSKGADFIGDAHDPCANRDESLDSIVAFNVLEHCSRPWIVVDNIYRWLKPKGRAFCMVPNVQRIHRVPMDYWRILPDAFALLFKRFRITRLTTYGNLLTSIAAFSGVAVEELYEKDLAQANPDYPVITCISAMKA